MKEYNYFSKTSYTYKEASEILTQKLKNENPSRIISEGHPEPYTAYDLDHIAKAINKYNIDCYVIENRKNDFQNYLLKAQYPKNYIDRFNRFFTEKAYEHFIILELMKLCNNQIYIDIGSGLVIFKGTKTGYAEGMEVSHAYPVLSFRKPVGAYQTVLSPFSRCPACR